MPTQRLLEDRWESWKRLGVLASEMESATLFTVCSALGAKAGALFNVVWNQERIKLGIDSPEVESHDTSTAILTAVNAIKLLIERSK
jgi:uridine phosphorylase